jgi:putative oxidoreductase
MRLLSTSSPTPRQLDTALLVVRVIIGTIFIAHGGQKLFTYGMDGVAAGFTQMGIPFASLMAPFISLLEFAGGIALVVGVLTRLAALGLALNMVGAIAFAHAKSGFFLPAGFEFALALFGAAVLLAVTGSGSFSVDAAVARTRSRRP